MATVAVLAYHKIGPAPGGWETWSYIPEETFVRQLTDLRDGGWRVLDAATFLQGLAAPQTLPARSALLTFDDGYRSNVEVAVPHLRRFGFPAVMFVPTQFIGGINNFDTDNEPAEPICDWAELRQLEQAGVSVQSHGVSHRAFSDLDEPAQEEELRQSRQALEDRLGKPVEMFAFPYGDDGGAPALAGRAGYQAAFLYRGGSVEMPPRDPFQIARIPMGPDTNLQSAAQTDGGPA